MAKTAQLYKYRAIRKNGVTSRGVLSAYSEAHLHEQLEKVEMELVSCSKVKQGGLFSQQQKITLRDKIQLFKSLEQMQEAGIPLLESLNHCCRSASTTSVRDLLNAIYRMVAEGLSLSEAMEKYPKVFSKIEVSVIKSKEKTGDMKTGFSYLTSYLVQKDELGRRIKKATRYPMILLFVILATIFVMLGYVTPQILEFVTAVKTNDEIPFATKSLMVTSEFFQAYWLYLVLGMIGAALFVGFSYKNSSVFRYQVDKFILSLPVIGELIRKLEISRFCTTLSSLYVSGITLMECMTLSQEVVENSVLQRSLDEAITSLSQGASLFEALNNTGEFPALVIQMIGIAEQSGNMGDVLNQVVKFYENDIDDAISAMIAMIEPMLTLLLASIIVWIAAAVFGPIYSMFEDIEF